MFRLDTVPRSCVLKRLGSFSSSSPSCTSSRRAPSCCIWGRDTSGKSQILNTTCFYMRRLHAECNSLTYFEWSKRGGLQIIQIWNGIWNPDKWVPFCQKLFEICTKTSGFWMDQFSNGWDYSYSHGLSPTIWKPDHLKLDKKSWIKMFPNFEWLNLRSPL